MYRREIYETFDFENAGDKLTFKPVLKKFEEYCNPRRNTTIQRHKFFPYRQTEGQSFNDFVTELKKLSSENEFDTIKDSRRSWPSCWTNQITRQTNS